MKLYKRGSVYWFELVFNGERFQRSTKSRNQRTAGQIMSTFHAALVKGEVGITERKKAPLLSAAMRDFLIWAKATKQEHPRTAMRYEVSSKALLRFFSNLPITKITAHDVERFRLSRIMEKGERTGRPLRPATINREVVCLGAMFKHFKSVAPYNPTSDVKPLAENNADKRILTFSEEQRYLAHASPVLRDVAQLMLATGCRPEEICSIRAEDVNLHEKYLRIPKGKTEAARRQLTLTTVAQGILGRRLLTHPSGYLFPHRSDPSRPMPKVNNAHDRAVRDSGVAFKIYALRHTWATRAIEAGIDQVTLASMLGHAKTTMVMRYAHPTQEHQHLAMLKMEAHHNALGTNKPQIFPA